MAPLKRPTTERETKALKGSVAPASVNPSPPCTSMCNHVPTPKVTIDYNFHPHIFDAILSYLDLDGLIHLRCTSRHLRDIIDERLARHIVMGRVHGRTVPTFPSNMKRRIPARNFWTSKARKDAVCIITIAPYKRFRSIDFPDSLAELPNVDIVLNWGCKFDKWFPLPRTRTWIAWPRDILCDRIPDVATERIVIVPSFKHSDPWFPPYEHLPQRPLQLVILLGTDWMSSDTFAQYGPSFDQSHCPTGVCHTRTDFVKMLACRIKNNPASGQPTIVLVGIDSHLRQHWPIREGRPARLAKEVATECITLSPKYVESHIQFYTADEYRKAVGEERFLLETTPPPRVDV